MFSKIGCTILHSRVCCTRVPQATSLPACGAVRRLNFSRTRHSGFHSVDEVWIFMLTVGSVWISLVTLDIFA